MRVSVIVPALNEEAALPATLRALQSLRGEKEIIIVDGGSTDATCAIATSHGVRLHRSIRGRGPQQHAGALIATGDVFWFVHADTLPPPESLEQIAATLADPASAGGNFNLIFDGASRAARVMTRLYPHLRLLGLSYGDAGIFVRRSVYERSGGFRPYALFEDLDLIRRVRRAGRFVHLATPIVTSSRRFEQRRFALVWCRWTALQVLFWLGVHPNTLARWYAAVR
jgi:rSAM/selenodomain-associated transferase 2